MAIEALNEEILQLQLWPSLQMPPRDFSLPPSLIPEFGFSNLWKEGFPSWESGIARPEMAHMRDRYRMIEYPKSIPGNLNDDDFNRLRNIRFRLQEELWKVRAPINETEALIVESVYDPIRIIEPIIKWKFYDDPDEYKESMLRLCLNPLKELQRLFETAEHFYSRVVSTSEWAMKVSPEEAIENNNWRKHAQDLGEQLFGDQWKIVTMWHGPLYEEK